MSGLLNKLLGTDVAGTVKKIQYYGNAKTQEGIPKLIQYLGDGNVEIRRAAARAMEHHWMTGNKDAIVALTSALDDADGEVRKNAALGLGEFLSKSNNSGESSAARQALIRLLQAENERDVIISAVVGLGYLQDGNLIGPMADALKAKDRKIISAAIDAIGNLTPTDVRLEMKKALRSIL